MSTWFENNFFVPLIRYMHSNNTENEPPIK